MAAALKEFEEAKDYWLADLKGMPPEIKLIPDHWGNGDFAANYEKKYLAPEWSDALIHMSNGNDLSLFIILVTILKILLHKMSRQDDIVVASPVKGEEGSRLNRFVLLRDYVAPELSFRELLMEVKSSVIEGYRNQHYPLANILELLNFSDIHSVFRVIVVSEQLHQWEWVQTALDHHQSDLIFYFKKKESRVMLQILYNSAKFKRRTAHSIFSMFQTVAGQVVENKEVRIKDIHIIPEDEKRKVLKDFNDTAGDGKFQLAQEMFQQQVIGRADEQAVIFNDGQLTYRELNKRVNVVAWDLREKGIGPDSLVALLVEASLETVVAILAVVKAGGAYVPIETELPLNRKRMMVKDCAARLILCDGANAGEAGELTSGGCEPMVMRTDSQDFQRFSDLEIKNRLSDLLYVVYTSGTTGLPKGVAVEQRGLINYIRWRLDSHHFPRRNVTLQLLSYAFDGFGSNFYTALLSGGVLVMVDWEKRLDARYLDRLIRRRRITHTSLIPGLYQMLLDAAKDGELDSLKVVVLAGERSSEALVAQSKRQLPRVTLINEYGPTETTVTATAKINIREISPCIIGKPITNCKAYILDSSDKLVSVGVPGEICISGIGVARGYLNHTQRTADHFIANPFVTGGIMYKTGDLGRWNASGEIEILGRIDDQVKIRGNRIEPGEIESTLALRREIKEVAAVAVNTGSGGDCLCAYVVAERPLEELNLREFLLEYLPAYMIPSYFVPLAKLPRTPGGKLDKRALPVPEGIDRTKELKPPRHQTDIRLRRLWGRVLGIDPEKIGIDANFFQLGGHSLNATTLAAAVHREFSVEMPLASIFETPVLEIMADFIEGSSLQGHEHVCLQEERDYYPLSSAQHGLFVMHQAGGDRCLYNIPEAAVLEGELDMERLQMAFERMIQRHESLRTGFFVMDGGPVQRIFKRVDFEVQLLSRMTVESERKVAEIIQRFVRPFDLSRPPLLRVGILKMREGVHLLVLDLHHIITDGTSVGLMQMEFMRLYKGEEPEPVEVQYKDFASWQAARNEQPKLKQQERYWMEKFSGQLPALKLPADFTKPLSKEFIGDRLFFNVPAATMEAFKKLVNREEATLFMGLLAVTNILLWKLSGMDDIVVGTPVANRRHVALERVVGLCVNMLALRTTIGHELNFRDFLAVVKSGTLEAYENQDFQFEELVLKLLGRNDFSRNPLFNVVLVLQNMKLPELRMRGLTWKPYGFMFGVSRFDLSFVFSENKATGDYDVLLEYSTLLFRRATAQKFMEDFRMILDQVLENPAVKIQDVLIPHELKQAGRNLLKEDDNDFGF
jgi:amino acid adenylation domain-containing protein